MIDAQFCARCSALKLVGTWLCLECESRDAGSRCSATTPLSFETEVLLRLPMDDWERLLRDMAGHLVGYHSWQRTLVVNLEGQLRQAKTLATRVEAKLK